MSNLQDRLLEHKSRRKFTNADVGLMRTMHKAGNGYRAIGKKFKCSKTTVIRLIKRGYLSDEEAIASMKRSNLAGTKLSNRSFTDEQVEEIRKLKDEGYTVREIANKISVKVNPKTIRRAINRDYVSGKE